MSQSIARPGTHKLRINMLRLTFVALLPVVLFSAPVWTHTHWVYEIFEVVGVMMVIAGVLGRFWSILYIGGRKNAVVMRDGPYSICRHPLYFFSTLGVTGFGIILGSVVLTLLLAGLTFLILSITAAQEEAWLRATHGPAYDAYAAEVPRILPDPRLFATADDVTFNVGQLRRNLMDALVFLSFIPLAELLKELKDYGFVPTFPIW